MAYNYNLPTHLGTVTFLGKHYMLHTIHIYPDERRLHQMTCLESGEQVEMEFVPPNENDIFADDNPSGRSLLKDLVIQRIRDEKW